jgi:hypothetical protein
MNALGGTLTFLLSAKRKIYVSAVSWHVGLAAAVISSPAAEKPVSFDDLKGVVIETRFLRQQTLLREGREVSNQFQTDLKIEIGSPDRIHQTISQTAYTARGTRKGKTMSGSWTLEHPQETTTRGGGHSVWIFADGTLTFLRTYQGGALKRFFTFTRISAGLACTGGENFAREQGVRGIVLNSGIDGVPTVILSTKPVSSTCRVAKQNEAGAQ